MGTLPLFTTKLSPSDYGIVALFIVFGNVTSSLIAFGINHASYRYYFEYKKDKVAFRVLNSSNILFMFFVYSAFGILVYHYSTWVSLFIFDGKLSHTLILFSFINGCLAQFYLLFTLILTAQERPITFAIVTISQILFKTIISLILIYYYSLTHLSIIYGTLLSNIVLFFILILLHREIIGLKFSFKSIKKSIIYSSPNVPRQLIGLAGQSIDKLLLNKFSGLTSLGNYTFGVKFATILHMILVAIEKVWTPFFMNKANERTNKSNNEIVERYYEIVFTIVLAGVFIIYFSEEMIKILTTEQYYPAMFVVPIYIYTTIFGLLGLLSMNQLIFSKKLLYLLPASSIHIIVYSISNILLIPKLGAIGAAISSAFAALFSGLTHYYYGQQKHPLPVKLNKIIYLFLLVLLFTIFNYPIMLLEINFLIKILLKLFIIFIFIYVGFKMNYINFERVKILLLQNR